MDGFLADLNASQQAKATYEFADDERFDLRLAPLFLEGLRLDEMNPQQRESFEHLLAHVLSPTGLAKVTTIRSLEREVAELEGGLFGFIMDRMRLPGRYFLAVFGRPRESAPWGMRFDGHHLSLNWTSVPDEPLSVTPLFLGGQPREVPAHLARAGLRVLREEEDLALELIRGLSEVERARARIPFAAGSDISRPMSVVAGPKLERSEAIGLNLGAMGEESQARLRALIEVALRNFVPNIAAHYRARLFATPAEIRFGFATPPGELRKGIPLYYRVQGSRFAIEYDNTSDAADHVHYVWREHEGDFGRDILAEHLRTHH
ncbi:MAG: DUF3500 domain-containing protein [Proteobacteria bacterium]|nr:DUF3500 domain-containing protein [Pseudomonadota bacterium]